MIFDMTAYAEHGLFTNKPADQLRQKHLFETITNQIFPSYFILQ